MNERKRRRHRTEINERLSRRKESARRKMHLAGEFYAELAEAAAAGFRAFREEVSADHVVSRGLPHSFVLGLTHGHSTFVEHAARATSELLSPRDRSRDRDDDVESNEDD